MTKQLMEDYSEYGRRKKKLVKQAYRITKQSYGIENTSSNEDSDGSDLEVMEEAPTNNLLKNMMNNLYAKKAKSAGAATGKSNGADAAINISSDGSGKKNKISKVFLNIPIFKVCSHFF